MQVALKGRTKEERDARNMVGSVFLVCRVHIRTLFVRNIPWDPLTLYVPHVHDERSSKAGSRAQESLRARILNARSDSRQHESFDKYYDLDVFILYF